MSDTNFDDQCLYKTECLKGTHRVVVMSGDKEQQVHGVETAQLVDVVRGLVHQRFNQRLVQLHEHAGVVVQSEKR